MTRFLSILNNRAVCDFALTLYGALFIVAVIFWSARILELQLIERAV